MSRRALVTGITGQDGAYMAQHLLEQGYEVYGAQRRSSTGHSWRLAELGIDREVRMVTFDLLEFTNILRIIEKVQPDEVYNLAAQSFVGASFEQPLYTSDADAMGVVRILEAIRVACPTTRFYQASTSELFGKVHEVPQTENTPFHPRSPYGVAKLYGHWITVNYREAHGLYAVSGILFNHESPLRSIEFVTRKITAGLASIRHGRQEVIEIGNLSAERDWGFAGDYVAGICLMLQQPEPDDYVLATGEKHSVREFVELAAAIADFKVEWEGEAEQTRAVDRNTGRVILRVNSEFYRPSEVDLLLGDSTKARTRLGWKPGVSFEELVVMMARTDLDRAARGQVLF